MGEGANDCGSTTHPHHKDTGNIDNRFYSIVAGQSARVGRGGRGGGSTRLPDNQDEGLDDTLAAEEIMHMLRDSPN